MGITWGYIEVTLVPYWYHTRPVPRREINRLAMIKSESGPNLLPWQMVVFSPDGLSDKHLRSLPGPRWHSRVGRWLVPVGLEAALLGHHRIEQRPPPPPPSPPVYGELDLHPYQDAGVRRVLAERSHLFMFEMGLGKTPTALAAWLSTDCDIGVVFCPAVVRKHWKAQVELHFPKAKVHCVMPNSNKQWKGLASRVEYARWAKGSRTLFLIPVDSARKLPTEALKDSFVIFDEIHMLSYSTARRTEYLSTVVDHPDTKPAYTLGLSATPIADMPDKLHTVLNILFPHRWGTYWDFCQRYCLVNQTEFGKEIIGVNPEHLAEFQERFKRVATVATWQEWRHLMPACSIEQVYVAAGYKQLQTLDSFTLEDAEEWSGYMATQKLAACRDIVIKEATIGGRCAVLTYSIDGAKAAADYLRKELKNTPVWLVTGEQTIAQRHAVLDEAAKEGVLVCSMKSVGVGIELVTFNRPIFLELYWSPTVLKQALGRFNRLTSKGDTKIYLLALEGTLDETLSVRLSEKLRDIVGISGGTTTDTQLLDTFEAADADVLSGLADRE